MPHPHATLQLGLSNWSGRDEVCDMYSAAQRSTTQRSTTQHSTAQHNTAQHSTARRSTAQHSTAQCRNRHVTGAAKHVSSSSTLQSRHLRSHLDRPVSIRRGFAAHSCTSCCNAEDTNEQGGARHPGCILEASPMKGGVLPGGPCHVEGDLPATLHPQVTPVLT